MSSAEFAHSIVSVKGSRIKYYQLLNIRNAKFSFFPQRYSDLQYSESMLKVVFKVVADKHSKIIFF